MSSWSAMAAHVLTYHLCLVVLVLQFWRDQWAVLGFLSMRVRQKTGSAKLAESQLDVLSADQALHAFVLDLRTVMY
jgi:hypothetical protein